MTNFEYYNKDIIKAILEDKLCQFICDYILRFNLHEAQILHEILEEGKEQESEELKLSCSNIIHYIQDHQIVKDIKEDVKLKRYALKTEYLCDLCTLVFIHWCNQEAMVGIPTEADWLALPTDSIVRVSHDNKNWKIAHFAHYRLDGKMVETYEEGHTSVTADPARANDLWEYGEIIARADFSFNLEKLYKKNKK